MKVIGCGFLLLMVLALFGVSVYWGWHSISYAMANGVNWPLWWLLYFAFPPKYGDAKEEIEKWQQEDDEDTAIGKIVVYFVLLCCGAALKPTVIYYFALILWPALGTA